MKLSRRLSKIEESATIKMNLLARKLLSEGKKVLNFSLGEPDFKTPPHICEAAKQALDLGYTHYTSSAGIMELREEIAEKLKKENDIEANTENVIVTAGAKQAIYEAAMTILDEGDAAILLDPAWVTFEAAIKMAGGRVIWVKRREEGIKYEMLEDAIASNPNVNVKMIVVNSPNNPVGYVLNEKELKEIADFSIDYDLFVISDEIYEKIIYNKKHISIASFDGMGERTIVINGFSKTYAMTGWRVGYAAAPVKIINGMLKIQQHSTTCASSISQFAALAAIRASQESVMEMVKEFRKRREVIVEGLNEIGLQCLEPEGAFYAFVSTKNNESDEKFAELLLKNAFVVVTPGSAFGPSGSGYVRFSYATALDNILEGLERIEEVIK